MKKYSELYVRKEKKWFYQNETRDCRLKIKLDTKEIKNGIILPVRADKNSVWGLGGVLYSDNQFVEESKTPGFFGGKYEYDKEGLIKQDDTVVFMGPFLYHWGHFLCDEVTRLWYVLDNNYKVAYCGWNWGNTQTSIQGNYLQLLQLIGVNEDRLINIQKPTQFVNVIIPDISFKPDIESFRRAYYTDEYVRIFEVIYSNAKKRQKNKVIPYEKIYFSRRKFQNAIEKEFGEERLENLFERNGYKILYPELLSLEEQIYYWNNAEHIVALEGSITHNVVFSRNSIDITILRKANYINGYQRILDCLTEANISYVDVYIGSLPCCIGLGPFLIGWNKYLMKFLKQKGLKLPNEENKIIDLKNFFIYMKRYIKIYSNTTNIELLMSQRKNDRRRKRRWRLEGE